MTCPARYPKACHTPLVCAEEGDCWLARTDAGSMRTTDPIDPATKQPNGSNQAGEPRG